MNLMTEAYITGVGAYLPGDPVGNEELTARFGDGSPRGAARRRRALAANGIRTRHYAGNDKGMTVMLNEELAAHAALRALGDRGLPVSAVRMLATGTTAGDVLVPGFASMVHGRLGGAQGGRGRGASRRASGGGRRRLGAGQPLVRRSRRSRRHAGHQLPALDALRRRRSGRGGTRAPAGRPEPAGGLDAPGLPRARPPGVHERRTGREP